MTVHTNPIMSSLDKTKVAVQNNLSVADAGLAQIQSFVSSAQSASAGIVETTQDIGAAEAIINNTAEAAMAAAQGAILENLNAGGGVDFLKAQQARLQQDILGLQEVALKEQEVLDRETDGVIDFFAKMFDAEAAGAVTDAAREDVADTRAGIAALTSSQESIAKVINTSTQTKTKATVVANMSKNAAITDRSVDKAMLDAASTGAINVARGMAASAQTLSAQMRIVELENTEINQKARVVQQDLERKSAALRLRAFEEGSQQRADQAELTSLQLKREQATNPNVIADLNMRLESRMTDITRNELETATVAADIQLAQASLNMPVVDADILIAGRVKQKTAGERAKFTTLMAIGARSNLALGSTPAEALSAVSILEITNSTAPAVRAIVKLNANFQKSEVYKRAGGYKTPGDYALAFNQYVSDTNAIWASNIVDGDTTNPMHAPPMAVLAESYESVKATKLYQKVLADMKMQEFSVRRIMDAGLDAGLEVISLEEIASGLEDIISAGMTYNRDVKLASRIGMLPQTTYNQRVDNGFSGGAAGAASAVALGAVGSIAKGGKSGGRRLTGKSVAVGAALAGLGAMVGSAFSESPEVLNMANKTNIMLMLNRLKVEKAKPKGILDFIESDPLNPNRN